MSRVNEKTWVTSRTATCMKIDPQYLAVHVLNKIGHFQKHAICYHMADRQDSRFWFLERFVSQMREITTCTMILTLFLGGAVHVNL